MAPRRRLLVWAAALLVALVGVAGYARLTAERPTRFDRGALTATAVEEHDVAVLSVDFDPPIDTSLQNGKQPSLLVAVDNRGTETETRVSVEIDFAGESPAEVLARLSRSVEEVTPGEVKVIRVSTEPDTPLQDVRWLTVQVRSAQGDADLSNNTKTLRVDARAAQRTD